MAFRRILTWPNPALKKKSEPVVNFDDSLKSLIVDLYDTLNVTSGVGIAAPQIGVHQRIILIDGNQCELALQDATVDRVSEHVAILINPEIEVSGPKHRWFEACLSIPDSKGQVERYQFVTLKYQTIEGESKTIDVDWPISGVLQHEYDHLDGVLYIDRMNRFSRDSICKKIRKRRKRADETRRLMMKQEQEELDAIDGIVRKVPKHGPGKRKKNRKRPPKKNHLKKKKKKKRG